MKQRTYCPICGATIRKLSRQECFKKVAEVFQNAAASCAGLDHRRCPTCGADLGQWSIHHCLIRVVQIVRDPSAAFERPPEPTKGRSNGSEKSGGGNGGRNATLSGCADNRRLEP